MSKPDAGSAQLIWTLLVAGGFVFLVLMQRPSQPSSSGAVAATALPGRAPASAAGSSSQKPAN
ncbi:MAG: hypothetical protein IT285_04970 [Bdellovibrionales bacterium]|nr:hypothetical protein [Bdellovibrionales bacterium]